MATRMGTQIVRYNLTPYKQKINVQLQKRIHIVSNTNKIPTNTKVVEEKDYGHLEFLMCYLAVLGCAGVVYGIVDLLT